MEYELIRSDRKTMSAQIKDGTLILRVPRYVSQDQIAHFLQDHSQWIETHLAQSRARQQQAAALPPLTPADIQALKAQAQRVIPERVAYFAPLVGVSYGRITIRCMKSRWGSCSSSGNLSFNCLLMLSPPEVVDSVVVHELCHRKEMNHSRRFYNEVLHVLPDYHQRHGWLREEGSLLLGRLTDPTGEK